MKQLIILFFTLIIVSCSRNVVSFSGEITKPNSDFLEIVSLEKDYRQKIPVKKNGEFSARLKLEDGFYSLYHKEYTHMYLKKGFKLFMKLNTLNFDESISYKGKGAWQNNYLAKLLIEEEKLFSLQNSTPEQFKKKIQEFSKKMNSRLEKQSDSIFVKIQKEKLENLKNHLKNICEEKIKFNTILAKGKPLPQFNNFLNDKGGKTSLEDFKGKNVYLIFWAAWATPCKEQMENLQKIIEKHKSKNIVFVTIPVNHRTSYTSWKEDVKKYKGIHLFTKAYKKITADYMIKAIPRSILIDTKGLIINARAPRIGSSELDEILDEI